MEGGRVNFYKNLNQEYEHILTEAEIRVIITALERYRYLVDPNMVEVREIIQNLFQKLKSSEPRTPPYLSH